MHCGEPGDDFSVNTIDRVFRAGLQAVDGVTAWTGMVLDDFTHLRRTLDGNDLDAWNPDYIRRLLPLWRAVMATYFRAEVRGLENIPEEGPCLLVGNHSGGTMIADTFVFAGEFYDHFGPYRRFHQLAHDIAARFPGTGIDRWGTVAASHEHAREAFDRGAAVLVYPGGDYETFRPSSHSDRIEFGGRKGFIRLALETGVPIVPVVAVGGQETALFVTRGERLAPPTGWASLTRIKVLPVALAPPFGISVMDLPPRLPLPAKIEIEVLEPIKLRERFGAHPNPDEVYESVTTDMQETLHQLAADRTAPVLG